MVSSCRPLPGASAPQAWRQISSRSAQQAESAAADARPARALLERARAAMGDAQAIAEAGGLIVEAAGTLNKGAEYQGRSPGSLDPGTFRESLAVVSAQGPVAYAYREERYDGTHESLREIYPGGDDRLIVLPDSRQVIHLRSPDHAAGRRKLARRVPQLLVAEALERPGALRRLDRQGDVERISAMLAEGAVLTLEFDARAGVLIRAAYPTDVQGFGDALVEWTFGDYARLEGLGLFPRRYGVSVAGRPFTDMRVTAVSLGRPEDLTAPDDFTRRPPVDLGPGADASAGAIVEDIASGVRRVRGLRPGFHPVFVEFADFVVALDAPAGYRLLNELPAGDVAPGPSSAWLSERYIALIKQAVPGKPIKYVVLTHFHNDHLGGVRAFVAEGTTVLAPPDAATLVEQLVRAPHTVAPDRLAANPRPLQLEVVRGRRTISDGRQTLEVIDVGANPHGGEMLVANLPAEHMMFVSDLIEPVALERYPAPAHAALDRFFVGWLDARRLDPEQVYTMHGTGLATRDHLEKLRPQ